jgi:hypothetical protein
MVDSLRPSPLLAPLAELFTDGDAGRTLTVPLPLGHVVPTEDPDLAHNAAGRPRYWLSDAPVPANLWALLRAEHIHSGLWPVLGPEEDWYVPRGVVPAATEIDAYEPAAFLADKWVCQVKYHNGEPLAPFGQAFPGLAQPGELQADPDAHADAYASWLNSDGEARLGLVPADCGADALAASGWTGPANYASTLQVAAVVRSWEERFGVRVVWFSHDTLGLSVAAPPVTYEHALQVTAEHWAFCPDIGQDSILYETSKQSPFMAYAARLCGRTSWWFWWD